MARALNWRKARPRRPTERADGGDARRDDLARQAEKAWLDWSRRTGLTDNDLNGGKRRG
jgi:hypothetical protein